MNQKKERKKEMENRKGDVKEKRKNNIRISKTIKGRKKKVKNRKERKKRERKKKDDRWKRTNTLTEKYSM